MNDDIIRSIKKIMKRLKIPDTIIKIIKNDQVYLMYHTETIKHDTLFRIGSNTKTFIGILVLQLIDEKILTLEDKVNTWIPSVDSRITIRMLLNMTSGIANHVEIYNFTNNSRIWEPDELIKIGLDAERIFQPDTNWRYSNTNTLLLGKIIESITNKSINQVLQERIFDRVHLNNTYFFDPPARGVAKGYTIERGYLEEATGWDPSWTWACGQIVSTIDDMSEWIRVVGKGKLLTLKSYQEMIEPKLAGRIPNTLERYYGLGVFVNNGWIGHNGSMAGYASTCVYHPKYDISIVVFANKTSVGMNEADELTKEITKILTPNNIMI